MEALIILLGDLIVLPLILMSGLLVELMAVIASLIADVLEFLFGITLKLGSKSKSGSTISPDLAAIREQRSARRRKWLKRFSYTFASVFLVSISAALILNFFFFESAARWGLARMKKRNGIEVTFESATGNLFSGRFELHKTTIVRRESATSTFNIQADHVAADIAMLRVFPFSAKIENVFLKNMTGEFQRLAVAEKPKIRKPFEVDHFRIEGANITLADRTRGENFQFQLSLEELDSRPLRSQFAAFDLLFRSNASGKIAGKPFALRTSQSGDAGRQTDWEASELPAAFVGNYFGGPLKCLDGGTVDIRVQDKWELKPSTRIDMQWNFAFKDLSVQTPTNAPIVGRILYSAIENYLRQHAKQLDVSFNMTVDENAFQGAASPGASGLWDAVRHGLANEIARLSGARPDAVEDRIQTTMGAVKNFLNRRRERTNSPTGSPK